MLTERAPYGVIGSITPTTNPTETILNNAIGMVAGGNAVVFNVHPYAARTSAFLVHLFNEAIVAAGGPENLIACVEQPTIESAEALMRHPGVRLVVVTGGPGRGQGGDGAGKKVIAAGPGNPPAVVDETADLDVAAADIVRGASIDNNIVCTAEKEIIAVASIADELAERLGRNALPGRRRPPDARAREGGAGEGKTASTPTRTSSARTPAVIARQIGVNARRRPAAAGAEVDEKHPFVQHELLMPVMPLVRVARRRRGDRDGEARRARLPPHRGDVLAQHRQHARDGARHQHLDLRQERVEPGRARLGGEGYTSFTIACPTGEGLTTVRNFTRERRCTLKEYFRIV